MLAFVFIYIRFVLVLCLLRKLIYAQQLSLGVL